MKSFQALTAGLLSLAFASVAVATPTYIHLASGQAFRGAVTAAIINTLDGAQAAYSGANLANAASTVISGTIHSGPSAGQAVVYEIIWSGSNAGIQSASKISPVVNKTFPTDANTLSSVSVNGTPGTYTFSGGTQFSVSAGNVTTQVDVTPSINGQGSTIFTGTGYTTLSDVVVGVTPLVFVRGNATTNDGTTTATNSAFASITNITSLQAVNLLNGGLPLSQFTGNVSDQSIAVYAIGRDEDAGQRVTTFDEVGFGAQSTPVQYTPTIGTGTLSGVITALNPAPAATVDGTLYPVGHGGYSSATTQAADLSRALTPGLGSFLISYFSTDNAASVTGAPGNYLSYNGVPFSVAAVQQGQYTFWSYSHVLYRPTLGGVALAAVTNLAKQLHDSDAAQGGILLSTLAVGRQVEGGPVTFGNPY